MEPEKAQFLHGYLGQIESQVQFGDTKASLLIAGNAFLLGINGSIITMVSGCPKEKFSVGCVIPSGTLGMPLIVLPLIAAGFLVLSLGFALFAARPASIHKNPPPVFFLLSHVARMRCEAFVESYRAASFDSLAEAALSSIHSRAGFATQKFRLLRYAIHATVGSLVFLVLTVLTAILQLVLLH